MDNDNDCIVSMTILAPYQVSGNDMLVPNAVFSGLFKVGRCPEAGCPPQGIQGYQPRGHAEERFDTLVFSCHVDLS